jgi:DNA-binding MarR family transcriptional regulator
MLKDKIGLDDKDALILSTLMQNPETSQQVLAKKLKLSEKMAVQTAIQDQLIKANLSMKVKIVGT